MSIKGTELNSVPLDEVQSQNRRGASRQTPYFLHREKVSKNAGRLCTDARSTFLRVAV